MSSKASLLLLLHAHLPFVHHPASSGFLEENWFFEAVAETYVPLTRVFERLAADHIRPGITLSISPTLAAMLENRELEDKLHAYLESRLELIRKEKRRMKGQRLPLKTLEMYRRMYLDAEALLKSSGGSLIAPLQSLQSAGQIEIITTSATHAVLPLIVRKEAVRAQTAIAAMDYERRFGRRPAGFWLPEAAYEPGLNPYLRMAGFRYFFAEPHAISGQEANAPAGVFSSYRTPNGLDFFMRDTQSSSEILDKETGYTGNPAYREFYRDIGFDADLDYIREYLGDTEARRYLGIKYYRITDRKIPLDRKEYYSPEAALAQAERDAEDYIMRRIRQTEDIRNPSGDPIIINCYNAELFGHWWFEGPAFLEFVIRKIREERFPLRFVTPSEYLSSCPPPAELLPGVSSWGENGYFESWVNPRNDFIYAPLCAATEKMCDTSNFFKSRRLDPLQKRAMNQAGREILLAQSSDWAYLIHLDSHSSYAKKRFEDHVNAAVELLSQAIAKKVDESKLAALEQQDDIFPDMDFRLFASTPLF